MKNGSRNETQENNGISHFIEHMLFKGTAERSAKDIADSMDSIGGQLNAFTAKENTCYYTRVLDNHFDLALDILADMFFNSSFSDKEIEKEKNVIYEEINMYEDTPEDLVSDNLARNVFKDNSLGYQILGSEKTISSFNNKTFVDYFRSNYCPENTLISIAGNFNTKEIVRKIENYFNNKNSFDLSINYKIPNLVSTYNKTIITKAKDIEQLHLNICFKGIEIGSENSYVLSVLNTLFGGGMSSRLFQKVREDKGLVYSIYSYNSNYLNNGLFSIYCALNTNCAQEALKYIIEESQQMRNFMIDEKTLYNTKEQIKSNFLLSLESTSSRMSNIGRAELMLNKILTPEDIASKIDAVSIKDISALSEQIFDLSNISLSAVGKLNDLDFAAMIS